MPLAPYEFVYSPDTTLEEATATALLLDYYLESGPEHVLPHLYTICGWATVMTTRN